MAEVWTLGFWKAKPGKGAEFQRAWREFGEWTMKNIRGVGEGHLLQDGADPLVFFSFGTWESNDVVATWRGTPEFQAFARSMGEICDEFQPHSLTEVEHMGRG